MRKKARRCEVCGAVIPAERIEILPDTATCVRCSQAEPYSEAEVIGFNLSEDHEANRLNMEDFDMEETDSFHTYSNEEV
jgi:hypothetical protein